MSNESFAHKLPFQKFDIVEAPAIVALHQSLDNTVLAPWLNHMFSTLYLITQLVFQNKMFSQRSDKDDSSSNFKKGKLQHEQVVDHFYKCTAIFILPYSYQFSTRTQLHFVHLPQIINKNQNALGHQQLFCCLHPPLVIKTKQNKKKMSQPQRRNSNKQ